MSPTMMMLIAFACGAMLVGGGLLIFMGPAARTWMMAHMTSKPVVHLPHDNKRSEFKRVIHVDKDGNYAFKNAEGKARIVEVDPSDVSIASNKLPLVSVLDDYDMSVSAPKAMLAKAQTLLSPLKPKKGEKATNAKMKWAGKSVSWENLAKRMRNMVGPVRLAGFMASAIEANQPHPLDAQIKRAESIKIVIIVIALVAGLVGVYIAQSMGLI